MTPPAPEKLEDNMTIPLLGREHLQSFIDTHRLNATILPMAVPTACGIWVPTGSARAATSRRPLTIPSMQVADLAVTVGRHGSDLGDRPAVFARYRYALQFLDGNFITPRIMGDRLGLHPILVLFAVLLFAALCAWLSWRQPWIHRRLSRQARRESQVEEAARQRKGEPSGPAPSPVLRELRPPAISELEERLDAVYAAKTRADLDSLTADLPVVRAPQLPELNLKTKAGSLRRCLLRCGVGVR